MPSTASIAVGQTQPGRQWPGRRNDQEQRGDNRGGTTISIRNALLRWLWVGCAGQGQRPVKVFEQPRRALEAPVYPPATARGVEPPGYPGQPHECQGREPPGLFVPRNHMQEACPEPLDLVWWAQPGRQDSGIRESSVEGGIGAGSGNCRVSHWAVAEGHLSHPFWGVPLC